MSKNELRVRALATLIALGPATVAAQSAGVSFTGGITAIGLLPDDDRIESDQTLSLDLELERETRSGRWFAYVEANSTLDADAVSSALIESNADAGTALDRENNGRIQLSEIHYTLTRANGDVLTIGLLDPSSWLDRTRITNDENVQFLGASFVQNATIEFPDYTFGVVLQKPRSGRRPQINAVLTSSHGIADNPNLSYSQLIHLSDDGKGLFAAVGFGWPSERRLFRAGIWANTREHAPLDGSTADRSNFGVYGVFGQSWGSHGLNFRLGLARDSVTVGSRFAAIAYRHNLARGAIGIGAARIFLSSSISRADRDDARQMEIFWRTSLTEQMHITVSAQHLIHSAFVADSADPRANATIAGLRFHYAF